MEDVNVSNVLYETDFFLKNFNLWRPLQINAIKSQISYSIKKKKQLS